MKQQHTVKSETETTEETVAPAGGQSDAELVQDLTAALRRPGSTVRITPASYSRIALEAAIPTAIIVGGVVAGVAALTLIDNKWGNGARANKLIDKGAFDKATVVDRDGMLVATPG